MSPETIDLLLAASRWLIYAGALGMVGARGALLVADRVNTPQTRTFTDAIARRLPALALSASVVWACGLVAMLAAQSVSWFGVEGLGDPDRLRDMIVRSRWGAWWFKVFVSAVVVIAAHVLARRAPVWTPRAIVLAALVAIVATPVLGHAAGRGATTWLLHSLHLAGSGLWIGTLLMLAWTTWPMWGDGTASSSNSSERTTALRDLLSAFTPVALGGAGLVLASGALLTTTQIWPLGTFFDTAYGAALSRKLVFVAVMLALGWLNWRHFRPELEIDARRRALRNAVRIELTIGFLVVLVLTAWLSGLPTPNG